MRDIGFWQELLTPWRVVSVTGLVSREAAWWATVNKKRADLSKFVRKLQVKQKRGWRTEFLFDFRRYGCRVIVIEKARWFTWRYFRDDSNSILFVMCSDGMYLARFFRAGMVDELPDTVQLEQRSGCSLFRALFWKKNISKYLRWIKRYWGYLEKNIVDLSFFFPFPSKWQVDLLSIFVIFAVTSFQKSYICTVSYTIIIFSFLHIFGRFLLYDELINYSYIARKPSLRHRVIGYACLSAWTGARLKFAWWWLQNIRNLYKQKEVLHPCIMLFSKCL